MTFVEDWCRLDLRNVNQSLYQSFEYINTVCGLVLRNTNLNKGDKNPS